MEPDDPLVGAEWRVVQSRVLYQISELIKDAAQAQRERELLRESIGKLRDDLTKELADARTRIERLLIIVGVGVWLASQVGAALIKKGIGP